MDKNIKKEVDWLLQEKYQGKPTKQFAKDVQRLNRGEPLDYVIGFTHFLSCTIDLSKKPLIPRPETEYWTEQVIFNAGGNSTGRPKKRIDVLDIFAGSGCIGIALLKHLPAAHVDFAEKYKAFTKQIAINAARNGNKKSRYRIIPSDVFSKVAAKYDIIVANPPYIPTTRTGKVQPSVLAFEPTTALFGGTDGLTYIRQLLQDAKKHLRKNGSLYVEFDSIQKKKIEQMLYQYGYRNSQFFKDHRRKWRWLVTQR